MGNGYPHSTIAQILEDIIDQLSFEGESHSNIADILLSILNQTSYDKEPRSVLAELFLKLKAKIEGEPFDPYDKETHSVIADILLSILNETEYADIPQSRIAELLLELKEELESYTEITVSGSIVSFTTNVSKPLVKLKANVEAQQDLHGYDKPWAGGGGSNKWDEEYVIADIDGSTGEQKTGNYLCSKNFIPVQPNTQYCITSPNEQGTSSRRYVVYSYDSNKGFIQNNSFSSLTTVFTTPNDCYYIKFRNNLVSTTYNHDIAINYPSTVTTYSPYSNICPITGWSGANVTRCGKNLLNNDTSVFDLESKSYLQTKMPSVQKIISLTDNDDTVSLSGVYFGVFKEYADSVAGFVWLVSNGRILRQSLDITDYDYVTVYPKNALQTVFNRFFVQVEKGTTATPYEPYHGNTYTIQFGSTYYGCELDVTNGVLRVTKGFKTFTGDSSENWTNIYNAFNIIISDAKQIQIPKANWLKGLTSQSIFNLQSGECAFASSGALNFNCKYDQTADLTAWKTYLASNNLQVYYELETPIEIQLTPQQIEQLEENNIWADTGDVEVTYLYKGTPET